MDIILSIKPKYCEKIVNGEKKVEFRKRFFSDADKINLVYMYATRPIKKIVGAFRIDSIEKGPPRDLWRKFKNISGISEDKFFGQFGSKKTIFAIKIKDVKPFNPPIDPNLLSPNFTPPRSFQYIKADIPFTKRGEGVGEKC